MQTVIKTFEDFSEIESVSEISNKFVLINTDGINNPDYFEILKTNFAKINTLLKEGGLLFVYGNPQVLPKIATWLDSLNDPSFLFKYWIAVESVNRGGNLPSVHKGLLMYLKTKSKEHPTPFSINTKTVRLPYGTCKACNQNLKDWGGKKHLMNELGSALSDVWYGNFQSKNDKVPKEVLERIEKLVLLENETGIAINIANKDVPKKTRKTILAKDMLKEKINQVILKDSVELMRNWHKEYPNGFFDMAFADPPYNLAKNYNKYRDDQSDKKYIDWCNEWLEGMLTVLRPGGALFVLNIPKWAIHHADFLLNKANFENWIVWDALSTPAGKLMPAHYALLYFTKPGGQVTTNYDKVKLIDSRNYCNRLSCVRTRKKEGNDEKEELTDIWWDTYRIKHKKDRDAHPCQLPIKLMERIIEFSTNEGDLIYDPFGGAGTTAIAAKVTGRNYIISDIDSTYVKIAKENLDKLIKGMDGKYHYFRDSQKRKSKRSLMPKKRIELEYMALCEKKNKVLELDAIKPLNELLHEAIKKGYPNFNKLKQMYKRKLENKQLIKQVS